MLCIVYSVIYTEVYTLQYILPSTWLWSAHLQMVPCLPVSGWEEMAHTQSWKNTPRKSLHKVSVLMLTNSILENLLVCIVSIWQNIMSTNTPRNLFPSTMEELGEGTDFNYCDGQPFLSTANQHYHKMDSLSMISSQAQGLLCLTSPPSIKMTLRWKPCMQI